MRERMEIDKSLEQHRRQSVLQRTEIQDLRLTCAEFKAGNSALASERDALARTCQALKASNSAVTAEKNGLNNTYKDLIAAVVAQRDALVKTCDSLQSSKSAITAENDALAGTCKALKIANALVTRTCNDLEASVTAVTAEKDALANTCKSLEASNGVLTTENTRLTEALETSNAAAVSSKAALVDAHTAAMGTLRRRYGKLKERKRTLRAACNDFEARIAALEMEKTDLETTLREMFQVVESQEKEIRTRIWTSANDDVTVDEVSDRGSSPAPPDASSASEEAAPPSRNVGMHPEVQVSRKRKADGGELGRTKVQRRS